MQNILVIMPLMAIIYCGITTMNINLEMQNLLTSFITATDLQNRILSQHFSKYTHDNPLIRTVPVGSLNQLIHPEKKTTVFNDNSISTG